MVACQLCIIHILVPYRGSASLYHTQVTMNVPDVASIEAWLAAVEHNTLLHTDDQFGVRAEVLDTLEMLEQSSAWLGRVRALQDSLNRSNEALYQRLRTHIATRDYDPSALRSTLRRYSQGSQALPANELAYDTLDTLVHNIVRLDTPPQAPAAWQAEMVPYQPTPMRLVFDLVKRTHLSDTDVFYDLGAGLGHVAIMVAIISGARAIGIEVQPAYCAYARHCAAMLNLATVSFQQQDARTATFAGGTLFYLYTPFHGRMLQTVLNRLRDIASHQAIRICTYGPCTATVMQQAWLTRVSDDGWSGSPLALFHSAH